MDTERKSILIVPRCSFV